MKQAIKQQTITQLFHSRDIEKIKPYFVNNPNLLYFISNIQHRKGKMGVRIFDRIKNFCYNEKTKKWDRYLLKCIAKIERNKEIKQNNFNSNNNTTSPQINVFNINHNLINVSHSSPNNLDLLNLSQSIELKNSIDYVSMQFTNKDLKDLGSEFQS